SIMALILYIGTALFSVCVSLHNSRTKNVALLQASNNVLLGGKETDEGEEVFEFNVDECLLRLRFGKYLLIAKELFGDDVGLLLLFCDPKIFPPATRPILT
ncbi:hypothetical protein FRC16_008086, partial [Serendipita sp. 398]